MNGPLIETRRQEYIWLISWKFNIKMFEWNIEWQSSQSGRITKSFFPSISHAAILNRVDVPYQLMQLFSGHCRLNFYLSRIKSIDSPLCPCGVENETIEHFLFHCPLFSVPRTRLKTRLENSIAVWPPPLSLCVSSPYTLNALKKFILSTKRITWFFFFFFFPHFFSL